MSEINDRLPPNLFKILNQKNQQKIRQQIQNSNPISKG